jgi:bis(5'-nucleosyl)-tetraphosphatase (symmetrical)
MSTYAVGDVQGCRDSLARLLDELRFDPAVDRLLLAGDLVNRGPDSAGTLRLVQSLGSAALAVLGNHDLHLLAVAAGGRPGRRDTLDDILEAPDREALLGWLRGQPLLHETGGYVLLHAGLPPQWTLADARAAAREVEAALRGADGERLLLRMYGDQPDRWSDALEGLPRLRFAINCFTRLRYCDAAGVIAPEPKGPPGTQRAGLLPWFAVPGRKSAGTPILFGHWSTLGRVYWPEHQVWGLDTGCIWGGRLSAFCLETGEVHDVPCDQCRRPDGVALD